MAKTKHIEHTSTTAYYLKSFTDDLPTIIDVQGCKDEVALAISKHIKDKACKVKALNLQQNSFTAPAIKLIVSSLSENNTVTILKSQQGTNSHIDDATFKTLLDYLKHNNTLETLEIHSSKLTNKAVEILQKWHEDSSHHNTALVNVDFGNNKNIDKTELKTVLDSIKDDNKIMLDNKAKTMDDLNTDIANISKKLADQQESNKTLKEKMKLSIEKKSVTKAEQSKEDAAKQAKMAKFLELQHALEAAKLEEKELKNNPEKALAKDTSEDALKASNDTPPTDTGADSKQAEDTKVVDLITNASNSLTNASDTVTITGDTPPQDTDADHAT